MAAAAFSTLLDKRIEDRRSSNPTRSARSASAKRRFRRCMAFNHMVGIDEDEFLAASQGTFKLGIEFVDWGADGRALFPSVRAARPGPARRPVPPALPARSEAAAAAGHSRMVDERRVAAELGRFARPGPHAPMPLSQLAYAFHFDAGLYARFLRAHAEAERRRARSRARSSTSRWMARAAMSESVTLADGRIDRRRAVHRLLRLPRAADRGDARHGLRGLEPLAAVRSCGCRCRAA